MLQEIELKYRDQFRSVYGDAFQHWFERLAVALHGEDCFLSIRVTRGDGGLDGLVLRQGRVYQLHAPPTLGTDSSTAAKVGTDFRQALDTLGTSLKAWTFVHNSPDGKVGHLTARALATLQEEQRNITIDALGIHGLWERLSSLPAGKLAQLFQVAQRHDSPDAQVRVLLKRADHFDDQGKRREAFGVTEEALAIAEAESLTDLQAEILVSLCLMSTAGKGLGERSHYFRKLQPLKDSITDAAVLVMFHRANAAYLQDADDTEGAESAYLEAIRIASAPDNLTTCGAHLCVARSEYVHLLCKAGRQDEAETWLSPAETYAKENPAAHGGEVFLAALQAGVHWAAATGDEDAAIIRIETLASSPQTGYGATTVAGQLINIANSLSHHKRHAAALTAAEAGLRLCHKMPDDDRQAFVPGALYTIATVLFEAGRLEEALQKAASLVNGPQTEKTASVRFAAAQLASVISRRLGDLVTAVDNAELALGLAPEIDSSFMAKMNLAKSLADQGQTQRALQLAREAQQVADGRPDVPKQFQIEALGQVATLAADLGHDDISQAALSKLRDVVKGDETFSERRDWYLKRSEAGAEIRKRLLDLSLDRHGAVPIQQVLDKTRGFLRFLSPDDPARTETFSQERITNVQQANALTLAPLLLWWEDTHDDHNAAALDYDYWGRGCFAQIIGNLQAFPHSLNVTVEVRTLDDARSALRLWSLYADFVLLLWKGPTKSGQFLHFVDGHWFGPWGAGYILALGTEGTSRRGRSRYPAIGYASWLPDDVAGWLTNEAKPFLQSGRALLVPASGVGCVSSGHGVMEQLLADVANAIPAIQGNRDSVLNVGMLPYARDIPLEALFDFISDAETDLTQMRGLLLSKAEHVRNNGLQQSPKRLELEIADTLMRLRSLNKSLARKRHVSAAEQGAHLGVAPVHADGRRFVRHDDMAFSPLLTLESMGYGWQLGTSAQAAPAYRYAPTDGEAIGAWLAPAAPGVRLLKVRKVD